MSIFPSRIRFFIGDISAVLVFLTIIQLLMTGNLIMLYAIYEIQFVWSDLILCSVQVFLNDSVILAVTSVGSIFLGGMKSAAVGAAGYCFYYLYMFNSIPIINSSLSIPISPYKNILCHVFPITRVMAPSYTDGEMIYFYGLQCILPRVEWYQILYILAALILGGILFWKKDLC